MDELVKFLERTYREVDNEQQKVIERQLDEWRGNEQVIAMLIRIVQSNDLPDPVRVNACIQIKRSMECAVSHVLNALPGLILSPPPFLRRSVNQLGRMAIGCCAVGPDHVRSALMSCVTGDAAHLVAGLVIFDGVVQKVPKKDKEGEPWRWLHALACEITPYIVAGFGTSDDLFVKRKCLRSIRSIADIDCAVLPSTRAIWESAVMEIGRTRVHNVDFMKYLIVVLNGYQKFHDKGLDIGGSDALVIASFSIMREFVNMPGSGRLIMCAFVFADSAMKNEVIRGVIVERFPYILTNDIMPLYVVTPEIAVLADEDPSQFVLDIPMSFVKSSLCDIISKSPVLAEMLVAIAENAITDFSRSGDARILFGRLLLVSAGWSESCKHFGGRVAAFYERVVLTLLQHRETLAQCSCLILMENENRGVKKAEISNPNTLFGAIRLLGSDRRLVQFYASCIVNNIITDLTTYMGGEDKMISDAVELQLNVVRNQMTPDMLKGIITAAVTVAKEFWDPKHVSVISRIVKDPHLMMMIVSEAHSLIDAWLGLVQLYGSAEADTDTESIFNPIINLIRSVQSRPEIAVPLCEQVFARSVEHFAHFTAHEGMIAPFAEIFNAVVVYCPVFRREFYACISACWQVCLDDRSYDERLACSYLFHNLMVRDPDFARENFGTFLEIGAGFLAEDFAHVSAVAVYHSALFTVAQPGMIPDVYISRFVALYTAGVSEVIECDDMSFMYDIHHYSQLYIAVLRYQPALLSVLSDSYDEWATLADDCDVAFTLVLCWGLLSDENRCARLWEIMISARKVDDLLKVDENIDDMRYEDQYNAVTKECLPIVTREYCVGSFRQLLQTLLQQGWPLCAKFNIAEYIGVI